MIKLQNLTPEIYYKQSRDFQLIGRLFDIVLNYVKTNADNLYSLPIGDDMNENLLNLLSYTLGFKASRNYNSKQLLAICSVLPEIMRHKGSLQSIIIAVNALLGAEGTKQSLDYEMIPKQSITLYLDQNLSDLSLLYDLLNYILPAGISCSFVKEISERYEIKTEIEIDSKVKATTFMVNNPDQQFATWVLPNTEMYRTTISATNIGTVDTSTNTISIDGSKLTKYNLDKTKLDAKNELINYKAANQYRAAEQNELEEIICEGKNSIDSATSINSIAAVLTNAKNTIDVLKTDAQYKADEQTTNNEEEA